MSCYNWNRVQITRMACMLLLILFSFNIQNVRAQRGTQKFFVPYSTVGFGIGTSSYYGDMAGLNKPLQSTFKLMRYSVTGNYTRHFTQRLAGRATLSWARIVGDDYTMNKGKSTFLPHLQRNLHFRNDLFEFTAQGIYKLTPDQRSSDRRPHLGAYLFAGIGAVSYTPKARTPSETGTGKGGNWVNLRKLNTEGQGNPGYEKPYSSIALAVPLGLGVRYTINKRFDVSAELSYRFTTTDYLDDVARNYPDPAVFAPGSLAEQMSNRVFETSAARKGGDRTAIISEMTEPQTLRGTRPGRMDSYMTGTISVHYVLSNPVKCPPIR